LAEGDLVLVKDQTTQTENGVYIAGTVPARSESYNSDATIRNCQLICQNGTIYKNWTFVNTNQSLITVGSTNITFEKFIKFPDGTNPIIFRANSSGYVFKLVEYNMADNDGSLVSVDSDGDLSINKLVINLDYGMSLSASSSGSQIFSIVRSAATKSATLSFSGGGASFYLGLPDSDDYVGNGTDFYIGRSEDTADFLINSSGNVGIGTIQPDTKLDVNGAITARELSADPSDPDEGAHVIWQSDGTGSGDDGDIMIKITAGGVTKTATLVDFSAIS
jgi:hypothetical protein